MDYNYQRRRETKEDQRDRERQRETPRSDMTLVNDLSKAIIGEVQAYYFYDELADLTDNDEYVQIIAGIQEDEAKHYNWFASILKDLGGELPRVPAGERPQNFEDGVQKAFFDELEANEFYLDTSYKAVDPVIKMIFLYASQDEQRHATLLQNILINQ